MALAAFIHKVPDHRILDPEARAVGRDAGGDTQGIRVSGGSALLPRVTLNTGGDALGAGTWSQGSIFFGLKPSGKLYSPKKAIIAPLSTSTSLAGTNNFAPLSLHITLHIS